MPTKPLTRAEIAEILGRNKGSKAELARRAKVNNNTVSMWLAGAPSSNVAPLAEVLARELLLKEEANRIAKGEANGPSARAFREQYQATKADPKKNPTEE